MKPLAIGIFGVGIVAALVVVAKIRQKPHEWLSRDGVWSISCPAGWSAELNSDGALNIGTPDSEGAVTISCYDRPGGDAAKLYPFIAKVTAHWNPVVPEKKTETEMTGEFVDPTISPARHVLVKAMHIKKHFVFITANDLDSRFEDSRAEFDRVIASFKWRVVE